MSKIIYVEERDNRVIDQRIASAFQYALYHGNSSSGNFRDSKGYRALKEAAYAVQREDSRSACKTIFVGD